MATPETEVKEGAESTETENQGKSTETENQGVVFEDGEEVEVEETEAVETQTQTPEEKEVTTTPAAEGETTVDPVQKKIDKLTYKRHEEREKREEAEAKLAAAEDKIRQLQGESDKVIIPPMPDPYDENFEQKRIEREQAIEKQAKLTAAKEIEQQKRKDAIEEAHRERLLEVKKQVNTMYSTAEKFGFKEEDFKKADLQVSKFIKQPDVANYILESEDSPLIVQFLYNNPTELEKVSGMTAVNAAVYIATSITPKAQELKPAVTETPEPLEIVKGKGGGEEQSPFLEGVTLE